MNPELQLKIVTIFWAFLKGRLLWLVGWNPSPLLRSLVRIRWGSGRPTSGRRRTIPAVYRYAIHVFGREEGTAPTTNFTAAVIDLTLLNLGADLASPQRPSPASHSAATYGGVVASGDIHKYDPERKFERLLLGSAPANLLFCKKIFAKFDRRMLALLTSPAGVSPKAMEEG